MIKNEQIVLIFLIRYSEESMFWFTGQKDYRTAISSLTKIARFNGLDFEARFREARTFLYAKSSKGIQCDFQPLLRLGSFSVSLLLHSLKT